MRFGPDGRLAADPIWCQLHRDPDDYHWTDDLVQLNYAQHGPRDQYQHIESIEPAPVGRECSERAVARGDCDERDFTEWRGAR